jgi:GWxTD domain-containing protein
MLLSLAACMAGGPLAEASERVSSGTPKFDLDIINTTSSNLNLSHLDIYVKINYDDLQFIKADTMFRARYEVTVTMLDKSGKPMDVKEAREEINTNNVNDIQSIRKSRISTLSFDLPPAKYEIAMGVHDFETEEVVNYKREVTLENYHEDDLKISDILYVDAISKEADGELKFTPKVSGEKLNNSVLYAYFEVYNVPESDSIRVEYEVKPKDDKKKVAEPKEVWLRSEGPVTKSYVKIADDVLPHGRYTARFHFEHAKDSETSERDFGWFWEGLPTSFSNLDEAIEALAYLVQKPALEKLKSTPDEKKHVAYLEFWHQHDPTPGTSVNEFRRDYYDRIKFANESFYGYRKPGWKTDMGWAYVKLGPPDSIDRNPYNLQLSGPGRSVKAYEVWGYYRHNRSLIFVDENGYGEFRLDNPEDLYDIMRSHDIMR